MGKELFVICFIALYSCQTAGKKAIVFTDLQLCEGEYPTDFKMEFYTNEDNELAFAFKGSYDYDIDENFQGSLIGEVFKGNIWVPYVKLENTWCTFTDNYKDPWKRAKEQVVPSLAHLDDHCLIPAGTYNLENYQITYEESKGVIESADVGKYRALLKLFIDDNGKQENVICANIEFEIKNE